VQLSPYTRGVVASWLPGREGALARIAARLQYTAAAAWQPQRPILEVGPRGFGKTSVLREAQRRAEADGMLTVWVTAGSEAGLIADIVAEVHRAATSWPTSARRQLSRAVRDVIVTVGVPGAAQVQTTLVPRHPQAAGNTEFAEFLRSTCEQAAKQYHKGVVLLIDEIQDANLAGLRTLALTWQHLQSEPPRKATVPPPALIGAGLPNSATVLTDAASYTERWEYERLEALTPDAAETALARPARYLGVVWHPAALGHAVQVTQGYPYLVQLLGAHAWEHAGNPDPGATIGESDVEAATLQATSELTTLYRGRWERATSGEQTFLTAMAAAGDEPVPRSHIAAVLGVQSRALSSPRASLIEKGIVMPDRHGYLSFTVPGFAAYVRSVASDELQADAASAAWAARRDALTPEPGE